MKNDWEIFEKLTSIFQILFGVVIIYATLWGFFNQFDTDSNEFVISTENADYYELMSEHYFSLLLGIIGIVGGIKWFFYKTNGWLLTILFWFSLGLSTSIALLDLVIYNSYEVTSDPGFWIFTVTILISILLLVILTLKFFRNKYKLTKRALITFVTIFFIILIDRMILNK